MSLCDLEARMDGRPLTVSQYHEMIRHGFLVEGDPIELIEGRLVTKQKKSPPHSLCTGLARRALKQAIPSGWFVESHGAVTLEDSEPEPDVMIVRGSIYDYATAHPTPADVALVIEIADLSLEFDRTTKRRLYARAGIPAYWITNLIDGVIEVHTAPTGPCERPDYRQVSKRKRGDAISFAAGSRKVGPITASDLLP